MTAITTPAAAHKQCARCTNLIGQARLEALPGTNICITCARTSGPEVPMVIIVHKYGDVDVLTGKQMNFASDGCQS